MAGATPTRQNAAPNVVFRGPGMLTLEQVREILDVKSSLEYSLVPSELLAGQFGGRGIWRVRESDLMA